MEKTFTIAHLSDLHLSPFFYPERSLHFRSILSYCEQRNVDHIIITGDITHLAKENEFRHFRKILKEFSLLDSQKMTVINGNHDIFGGPYYAEDVLNFPSACRAVDYGQKMDQFFQYTKETFLSVRHLLKDNYFPFLKIIGDIAIVGINSVPEWHAVKNPLGSNGKVNRDQFENLKKLLKSGELDQKTIVIAIHHHFAEFNENSQMSSLERMWTAIESVTLKLRKKKRLIKLFSRANVAAVLHGHVHCHGTYIKHGLTFANAGATIVPAKHSHQAFHLFSVRAGGVTIENMMISHGIRAHQKINVVGSLRKRLAHGDISITSSVETPNN
ncbi:MAG: metallophosphoesterase [Bacteroidota bacterium]